MGTQRQFSFARALNVFGPYLGLLFVLGVFCANSEVRPYFLTGANFKIILTQTVIVAICALGMTMIIVGGGIDLSIGSSVALAGVVGATFIAKGVSFVWVVVLTILSGGLVGVVNGTVIAGFRMMPFVVTLGMMGVARGAAKWLAGNQTVNYPECSLNRIMALDAPDKLFPLPWGVWLALGLAVIVAVVMNRSIFGRYHDHG